MIPDLDPIEWAALGCGAALVELVGAYCLVAPWLSRINGNRFDRETPVLSAAEREWWAKAKQTKTERDARFLREAIAELAAAETFEPKPCRRGLGETLARAAHWLAVKATRSDRTEADR